MWERIKQLRQAIGGRQVELTMQVLNERQLPKGTVAHTSHFL